MTQQKLTIARSSSTTAFVLNPQSLERILQVAGNQVETLKYLEAALLKKTGKNVMFAGLMAEVNKIVANATFHAQQKDLLDPWSGDPKLVELLHKHFATSEFEAFQEFMARTSAANVNADKITMDYAVSKSGQFLRAYSSEDNPLATEALASMDTLFNAYLAKSNLISEGGVIYQGTPAGGIKQDNGSPVHAMPEEVIALLSGNTFADYVNEKAKSARQITISIRQNEYPEEAPSMEQTIAQTDA